jgi:hypothetical protein
MAKPNPTAWSREDRDLLVELRTRLVNVEAGVGEMKTGVTSRLLNLEGNSITKVEFDDHEQRLRSLETQRWMIAGAVMITSALAGYALQVFF